jgi:3',5'-cyclic AMP phosphodiesterase CpdA
MDVKRSAIAILSYQLVCETLLKLNVICLRYIVMIIAQISDTHIDLDSVDSVRKIQDLERCVSDINGLDILPDVVIHTGDLAHNGTVEKYLKAMEILKKLQCPLFIAAGNRDNRVALSKTLPNNCCILNDTPYIQYSIDTFPVRLIAIDTLSETTNMGDFCDVRAENLRKMLEENRKKPTVIFMHHPPFEITQSKHKWQFDSKEAIIIFEKAVEGHMQILRAFCGHSHREALGMTAGIPASCTPSIALNLRLGEYPNAAVTSPVYQIHRYVSQSGFSTETRIVDEAYLTDHMNVRTL